jgi:hypothetical protein
MSKIALSPIVDLVSGTYAAAFVSMHTFTAGVTLSILGSTDPLNLQSGEVKFGLHQLMVIQEKLKSGSVLAAQGLGILQRLARLVVEKELNMMLDVSNRSSAMKNSNSCIGATLGSNTCGPHLSLPSLLAPVPEPQVVLNQQISTSANTAGLEVPSSDAPNPPFAQNGFFFNISKILLFLAHYMILTKICQYTR